MDGYILFYPQTVAENDTMCYYVPLTDQFSINYYVKAILYTILKTNILKLFTTSCLFVHFY